MTSGEKRFARRLESHLEDDYLCWYEVPVGRRIRYTDFIVLHPARGLLLLEVKDWKIDTIRAIDRASVSLLTPAGQKVVGNPIEQVRQCAYRLVNTLEKDPQLTGHKGPQRGRLVFPYGYGVVLTNITRKDFERHELGQVMPAHQVICADEMTESTDVEVFQKRLWDMFNATFSSQLTLPQIDRVRWHLFPEVRIADGQAGMFDDPDSSDGAEPGEDLGIPDIIRVMDRQQEQLARSMGGGHRVIHGVAGSGKTLILGYRCLYLAKLMHKPILVVCFNITLAARLRRLMIEHAINDRVHVYHFHDWCAEQLKTYHVPLPPPGNAYPTQLVERVISATDHGHIPRGQYGAVMIDEGHDFEADWLRLIAQMVDPDEGSLLLLYDDAQSIYHNKKTLDFSLSSVGIQAQGRTTILKLNYRNTREILDFAYRFAAHYLSPADSDEDHVPLIAPEAAGRRGPAPYLKRCTSLAEEIRYIAKTLRRLNQDGLAWRKVAVTCRSRWLVERLALGLKAEGIPVERLLSSTEKRTFDPAHDSVKVMTMHSSKGLEFPMVVIPGVGELPVDHDDSLGEAKLLYVAMTRAIDKLLITASEQSEFVRLLSAA